MGPAPWLLGAGSQAAAHRASAPCCLHSGGESRVAKVFCFECLCTRCLGARNSLVCVAGPQTCAVFKAAPRQSVFQVDRGKFGQLDRMNASRSCWHRCENVRSNGGLGVSLQAPEQRQTSRFRQARQARLPPTQAVLSAERPAAVEQDTGSGGSGRRVMIIGGPPSKAAMGALG